MENRRYFNPTQPQTLQIAVMLLYFRSALLVFDMVVAGTFPLWALGVVVAGAGAAYGVANERKWGYGLAIATAIFPFALRFLLSGNPLTSQIIQLMFEIALVALLLHPLSREYQRIWFK